MAELQWVIEVRCVNTTLAEVKVDQRGEHVIVIIPNRRFDPPEFGRLIEALEEGDRLAAENRKRYGSATPKPETDRSEITLGKIIKLEQRTGLYDLQWLGTGELVIMSMAESFLTPSELRTLIRELKSIQAKLRI